MNNSQKMPTMPTMTTSVPEDALGEVATDFKEAFDGSTSSEGMPAKVWLRAELDAFVWDKDEPAGRESNVSLKWHLGKKLSNHAEEIVSVEVDDEVRKFRIRKARNKRTGKLATVYMFEEIDRQ